MAINIEKNNLFDFSDLISFTISPFEYFPCIFKVILALFNLAGIIVFSENI